MSVGSTQDIYIIYTYLVQLLRAQALGSIKVNYNNNTCLVLKFNARAAKDSGYK